MTGDIFPCARLVDDFWRVNSYGYPCYFSESSKSQEAWATLLPFFEYSDYSRLKAYWSSKSAPRQLSSNAVESWKATFEEFGLLYVISGSNEITITPAGRQLLSAADRDDKDEFAWIGLNLLLRYPLRGPRRAKSVDHADSDLLLYRFLYSAMVDLDGYLWWSELENILCRVFQTDQAVLAIEDVRKLRSEPALLERLSLVTESRKGGFYNSLNQVAVHAGMNHLLLDRHSLVSPYGVNERRHSIRSEWAGFVRKSLVINNGVSQCITGGLATARLPTAPRFSSEAEYFEYLGAPVKPFASSGALPIERLAIHGEDVFFLSHESDYKVLDESSIVGSAAFLCQLARGQRIILSHDDRWTYLVMEKHLIGAGSVRIAIRRARPISDVGILDNLRGMTSGER